MHVNDPPPTKNARIHQDYMHSDFDLQATATDPFIYLCFFQMLHFTLYYHALNSYSPPDIRLSANYFAS